MVWSNIAARARDELRSRTLITSVVAAIAFFFAAAAWALATPPMSSADDDFHVTSIVCSQEDSPFCIKTDRSAALVPKSLTETPCYAQRVDRGADCFRWQPEWVETSRWNSERGDRVPVFYTVMSWFVGEDLWRSILTMRLANSLFAAVVFGITLAAIRLAARRALALSIVAVLFPVGVFHVASTNPTGWAIIGLSVFWVYLIEAWSDGRGVKIRLGFLIAAAFAALVAVAGRSDSAVYLMASVVAVALVRYSFLRRSPWWGAPILALLAVALVFGWDRIRSALSFVTSDLPNLSGVVSEWWPRFHLLDWPLLMHYVVGGSTPVNMPYPISYTSGVGWDSRAGIPTEFPPTVSILALLAVAGVVWIGLSSYSRRKLMAVAIVLITIFVMSFGWIWLSEFRAWTQARYYVAPVMVLVGLISFSPRSNPYFRKAQAVLLWFLVTVAGTAALKTMVGRTISGQALVPGHHWSVENNYTMWWWESLGIGWPPSPNYTVVIGGVALAVLAATLLSLCQLKAHEPHSRRQIGPGRIREH